MDSQVDCTPEEKEEILRLVRSRMRAQRRKPINVCTVPVESLRAILSNLDVKALAVQCHGGKFGWVDVSGMEILGVAELVSISNGILTTSVFEAFITTLLEDPVLAKHRWASLTISGWSTPLLCAIVADGTIWTAKALTGLSMAEPIFARSE